ncbi:cAMP-dependent protein kinase catalytic subunit [Coemansia sp. RSA 1843]|nr:cAMP-dependent protein kinase catalytic subunit [Coemansia sp. RSA 1843]
MFGRLNAKLAHLKANSQRTQTQGSGASLSPLTGASTSTAEGTSNPPSVFGTASATTTPAVQSASTSRAGSPSPQISSFQAARVAASHAVAAAKGLSLNIQSRQQQQHRCYQQQSNQQPLESATGHLPQQQISSSVAVPAGNPALKSYHIYVETPSENSFPPILSPTTKSAPKRSVSSNKRRLSSPRVETQVAIDSSSPHQAKHSRLDSAIDTCGSPAHDAQEAVHLCDYQQQQQQQQQLGTENTQQQQPPMLSQPNHHYPQYQSSAQKYTTQATMREQQPSYVQDSHGPKADAVMSSSTNEAPQMVHNAPTSSNQEAYATQPHTVPSEGRTLDDYQMLNTLGTGTFGRVFLSQSKLTKRFYAMKVLRKSQVVKLKQVEHINNEKNILEVARHPFIVQLECTMQNERNLYMLMEYVPGGELFSHLRRAGRFPDDVARFYAAEIVLALDYLHSMKIIWRDTKPENILLDAHGHVKLTDFGFAKRVEDRTWTLCGTPEYLAPEIIQSKGHGKAVDWWALGILIFEMLVGYPPFYDDNPFGIYEKILGGKLVFPAFFSGSAKDLITRLLTADVSKRLGNLQGDGQDVKSHAWFSIIDWQLLVERRVPPPIVPPHRHPGDTCNFDRYPEPPQEPAPEPGLDPYRHLFATF